MRYVTDGPNYHFAVCDFCECDSSGSQTKGKVFPLGDKGICLKCLQTLKELLEIV